MKRDCVMFKPSKLKGLETCYGLDDMLCVERNCPFYSPKSKFYRDKKTGFIHPKEMIKK